VALQLVLLITANLCPRAYAAASLKGIVLDENGSPMEDVIVSIWLGKHFMASDRTGVDGNFSIQVGEDTLYIVSVFADYESTPGFDYLPSQIEAAPSDDDELIFNLRPAASLVFEGDIQFVESEELPSSITYLVLDPTVNGNLSVRSSPYVESSMSKSQRSFLGLESSNFVVPAGVPFSIVVNCSILVESGLVHRSFKVDKPDHFLLEKGERATVNIRQYSVPFNLGVVEALYSRVYVRISEMESVGFYLAKERGTVVSAVTRLNEARNIYECGRYIESFDAAKRSYIELGQTLTDLARSYNDAALSVYLLIFLLAFMSTAIAFLLSNRDSTKLMGSTAIYVAMLTVLYITYPGSTMIPFELFLRSTALALLLSLAVAAILPQVLRGRGGDGHLPVSNIVIPIFSMAKRNIRRRRMRSALTLTSITVLVMSFVALTSFSDGYNLIVSRVSKRGAPATGILLRAPGYTVAKPVFISMSDINSGWLERQPESRAVSPKAENLPLLRPLAALNSVSIFGVVGIDPSVESAIIGLEEILVEGELPSEGDILISEALYRELRVEVGDRFVLGVVRVTLRGVFDDAAFLKLKEIDGSTYLPWKLVNIDPEGATLDLILLPCEPSEVIVAHLSTALSMPHVGVARVGVAVEEGFDMNAFAERLALERGYKAWSSSTDGVYFACLGSYTECKGLALIVPWGIVVLNVVVTMLNSIYERRKEIHILSSLGLNPAQIATIFVAEASIIGIIGGGAGYIGGLALYKAMASLRLALEVHQKVSALWSLAAICIAITAVLIGALSALKSSVIITPSLMRRWRIEKGRGNCTEPWELSIPVRLFPQEVEDFVDFIVQELKAHGDDTVRMTSSIRVSSETEGTSKRIDFVYRATQSALDNFYTKNTIIIERKSGENEIAVRLISYSDQRQAHDTGSMVRLIAMEWSTYRGISH